ncbi:uncharacterized protein LOC105179129 [Sesamum indicum]|uniref:Uncharacterized protein LOC105179129 n=1 Tax=Sesamum indicum TaxID=4182 RepID=A0A6I9UHC6_SESIN|nr:uncharacterized protein LOC105179129 [Sesamum indicum]
MLAGVASSIPHRAANTFEPVLLGFQLPKYIRGKKKKEEIVMDGTRPELHFVFMNYDPEYERLRSNKTKRGAHELDLYLSRKHEEVLAKNLQAGTYRKTLSLVIVDGFAVEITDDQANVLRSAEEVRIVEKNQELA